MVGLQCSWTSLLVLSFLLVGCDILSLGDPVPHGLWIGETGVVMAPGDTAQLTALAMETRRSLVEAPRGARWSAADTTVALVSADGRAHAVRAGRTTVWIEAGERRDSATLVVRAADERGDAVRWRQVAVGAGNVCAVTAEGATYCWGRDYWGLMGDGHRRTWTLTLAPQRVETAPPFREIAVGALAVCGRTAEGETWCWGRNESGATGSGSWSPRFLLAPTVVPGHRFTTIDTRADRSGGLTEGGTLYSWGSNAHGQIGDGTGGIEEARNRPTAAESPEPFVSFALGDAHTCGLTAAGRAWCWGDNFDGRLGVDAPLASHHLLPTPVRQGQLEFAALASGLRICGLTADGETYCWRNMWDEGYEEIVPVRLEGAPRFRAITGASGYACGLTEDDRAYCWGFNEGGQLGTREPATDSCSQYRPERPCARMPVPVAGEHRFSALAAGQGTTCGITTGEELYCWGSNFGGRLGIGAREPEHVFEPVRVADPL